MGKTKKHSGKERDRDSKNVVEGSMEVKEGFPLPKLVLKVGKEKSQRVEGLDGTISHGSVLQGPLSHSSLPSGSSPQSTEHTTTSHHKKKKKKHKHRSEESEKKSKKRENTEAAVDGEPPAKKVHVKVSKEKEKKETYKEPEISPLALCLENLHRNLQRKDVYGIFTFPVTDLIAPGYSKIIKAPMDFLTMSKKIGDNEYSSCEEFRNDFVVMCNNAMLYNGSDTIYYKSAEKMLSIGLKMLSKEKLVKLHKSIGVPVSDSDDDVIIDDPMELIEDSTLYSEETYSPRITSEKKKKDKPAAITASVLASARKAREKLMKKHPNQLYGYLSSNAEGKTSLNILNPDTTEDSRSAPVTIGKLAGKLQSGMTAGQCVIKEDKKNKVVPVNYLIYGPYGSFGPAYDSSLSNVTKEESDVLMHTYGSEGGVEYIKSLMRFTEGAPYARDYVDRILDVLTDGAHGKHTQGQVKGKEKTAVEEEKENIKIPPADLKAETPTNPSNAKVNIEKETPPNVDINSLLTLDGVGIDVSFLKDMVKPSDNAKEVKVDAVQGKLSQNAELLQNLKQAQNIRIASKFAAPIPASEIQVAVSITDNLKDLMGMVTPKDVVSSEGVRKAIGCGNPAMHTVEINKPKEFVPPSNEVVGAIPNSLTCNENKEFCYEGEPVIDNILDNS